MSDPVSQAEIEDVLSSIRRLVSEDGRVSPKPSPVQAAPKAASRLVLTPALRVAETTPSTEPAPAVADEMTGFDSVSKDAPVEEAQVTELQAEEAPAAVASPIVSEADAAGIPPVEESAEVDNDEVEAVSSSATQSETRHDAEDIAAVDDLSSDMDSGPTAAPWHDPQATLYQAAASGAEEEDDTAQTGEFPDEESLAELSQEALAANSERVSAVVQKIAELEAKVAHTQGQWEPDGASSDPYAGTNIETLEWTDHIEDTAEENADQMGYAVDAEDETLRVAEEAVIDETLETIDNLTAEEGYLDEESLRELVAEIVRSELQGALGERITRNVRKLVRREIQRALAAQDLI